MFNTKPTIKKVDITTDEYYGEYEQYMSAHQLEKYFRNPALFHKVRSGLITEPEKTRQEYAFGTAAHEHILEPEEYKKNYVIVGDPPTNKSTGKGYGETSGKHKGWLAECSELAQGKLCLSQDQHNMIVKMTESTMSNPAMMKERWLSGGKPEQTYRGELMGVKWQSRMDFVSNGGAFIVDYKTIDDIDNFEKQCKRFGYFRQAAAYTECLKNTNGLDPMAGQSKRSTFVFVVCEKKEPFRSGAFIVGETTMAENVRRIQKTLKQYRQSMETGHFPTYYEKAKVL